MDFKCLPFELKAAGNDGTFEGVCSAFNNIDSYGEIVDPAAFDATLPKFLADGFIGGLNHNWDSPIGKPMACMVTRDGLVVKGKVSNTPHAQECMTLMRDGVIKKMSIGYRVAGMQDLPDSEACMQYWQSKGYTPNAQDIARSQYGARVLTAVDLYEASPVTVPANELATITAVKRAALEAAEMVVKAASGNTSLPLAPRDHPWDGPAAEKRVREWAGAQDGPNAKYRSAFFWYDSANADQFGSYHLGFADILNGTLTAIPHGIFACAAALQGARGADGSKYADAKPKVERYYARMRKAFNDDSIQVPWDDAKSEGAALSIKTERDFEQFLRDAGFSRSHAVAITNHGFKTLLRDAASETTEPDPEVTPDPAPPTDEPTVDVKTSEKPDPAPDAPDETVKPRAMPSLIEEKRQQLAQAQYQRFLELQAGLKRPAARS